MLSALVSLPQCLPEPPISPRACLCLISPSQFTQRKFLEGWARQIAADLSLSSGVVSFFKDAAICKENSNDRLDYFPPSLLQWSREHTHRSLRLCVFPFLVSVPVHLSLLNEAGMLPVDSGGTALKLPPCWEFELDEGGPLWTCQKQKPATCRLFKAILSIFCFGWLSDVCRQPEESHFVPKELINVVDL